MGFKDLKWYLIGFGSDKQLIRQKIAEAGMEEHVIMLGKKDNPYPYIKACDVYVQPSRYEGKSVTVREAQVLCKPVIVTSYPTARSQVRNGVDGIIVPQENEGCADGIAQVIQNSDQLKALTAYLQENDYGNEQEVEKVLNLI
jgi:glycosyltransferase involved in cell wall biosynthesis